jgi:type I restriction enzyme M protein
MSIEQYTRDCIRNDFENKKWIFDKSKPNCNVTQEQAKTPLQKKKLKGNKPDYVLYETNTDNIIAIIEAKHGGYTDLNQALNQAEKYAKLLQSNNRPIALFSTNGSIYQTRFFPSNDPLIFNGQEVKGLLEEDKLLLFINSNTNNIDTTPKEVIKSKEDLIKIFKNLNDVLRSEGLRAGIERFTEFSNLLFLKLISEHNQKPWWKEIKQNLKGDDDTISYINNHIFKQIQGEYGGNVITPISIKNESTLKHIINAIDPLVFSTIDTDIKGDAFEYFLEKTTSTENDLGEYFTPRHVVKAIVDFVSPKYNEKIYDPFCGTGGFLTNAFHYVRENNNLSKEKEYNLKNNSIYGHELTTTAKTAKMNMILQGDGHSGIKQINSLFNPIEKKYDLIITNIPFSQKIVKKVIIDGKQHSINEVTEKYENSLAKNSGDAVCVLHCFRSLKEGKRMALVVPEGFLFRNVEKYTRRFLLDNSNLEAIISLPQGTFLPYTAVKTSILYFTNVHTPKPQKEFWYYEAKNIGFSLDNHRRVIHGFNDLDMIKSSINKFKKARKDKDIKKGLLQDGFQLIDLQKVVDNNYNLVGGFYREVAYGYKHQFESLLNVLELIESGSRPKGGLSGLTTGAISLGGQQIGNNGKLNLLKTPFVTIDFFKKAKKGIVKQQDILMCKDGALTGKVCFVDNNIARNVMVNEHVYIIRANQNIVLQRFLFFCLYARTTQQRIKSLAFNKSAQPGLNKEIIKNIKIPLPPIDQQQEIVNELDSYHKIIDGCQQIIDNWKPRFEIEESWKLKKLGDFCDFQYGFTSQSYKSGNVRYLRITDIEHNDILKKQSVFINLNNKNKKYLLEENDIVIARMGSVGKSYIYQDNEPTIFASYLIRLIFNKVDISPKYLKYCFDTNFYWNQVYQLTTGAVQPQFNVPVLKNIKILLPPLDKQQEIVKKIEFERNIIEQNEKLVEIYKEKVADKLNKLFN